MKFKKEIEFEVYVKCENCDNVLEAEETFDTTSNSAYWTIKPCECLVTELIESKTKIKPEKKNWLNFLVGAYENAEENDYVTGAYPDLEGERSDEVVNKIIKGIREL